MSDERKPPRTLIGAGPPEEREQRLRWDALDVRTRWRIVRTVERGEAMSDRGEAELALWLARARRRRGRPKLDRTLAFIYPVLAVVFVLLGTHPAVAFFLVVAALLHFGQSQRWPKRAARLERAEQANLAVVDAGRPPA